MKKTVTYSVVGRVNPADRESGEVKYYAQSQARGEMGIREIAERIHQMCTVTRADVMAVLTGLEDIVSEGLQGGEIVRTALRVTFSFRKSADMFFAHFFLKLIHALLQHTDCICRLDRTCFPRFYRNLQGLHRLGGNQFQIRFSLFGKTAGIFR